MPLGFTQVMAVDCGMPKSLAIFLLVSTATVLNISKLDSRNQDLHNLFAEYVNALWVEIGKIPGNNIHVPQLQGLKEKYGKKFNTTDKEQGLNNVIDFWYKSIAGEMGIAVGAVNSTRNQRRIIQSLYDLAASIAFRTGMTKEEKEIAKRTGDTSYYRGKREATFKGGPYVKVY